MNRRRAFTLIEVLVAVSILGAGVALAMGLFAGGLNLASVSREYVNATLLAQELMVERLSAFTLDEGEERGEEGDYTWEVNIERYYRDEGGVEEENAPLRLYQIAVNVAWPGRLGEKRYELVTLRSVERRTLTTGTLTTPDEDTGGGRRPGVIPTPAPRPERRPRGEGGGDGGTGAEEGEGGR